MTFLFFLMSCRSTEPDAAPFAGVLRQLDADADGRVTLGEYPARPQAGAPAEDVDRDDDGVISAEEVRDEVYALDPAAFDRMAWKRSSRLKDDEGPGQRPSERGITGYKPLAGPLAEALRFLADLAAARAPGLAPLTSVELDAAALAGMDSPAGALVLQRLRDAGVELPPGLEHAPADPPDDEGSNGQTVATGAGDLLRSGGPGGAGAVRVGAGRAGGASGTPGGQPPGHPPGPGGKGHPPGPGRPPPGAPAGSPPSPAPAPASPPSP